MKHSKSSEVCANSHVGRGVTFSAIVLQASRVRVPAFRPYLIPSPFLFLTILLFCPNKGNKQKCI